jgi:hypothetical protein
MDLHLFVNLGEFNLHEFAMSLLGAVIIVCILIFGFFYYQSHKKLIKEYLKNKLKKRKTNKLLKTMKLHPVHRMGSSCPNFFF